LLPRRPAARASLFISGAGRHPDFQLKALPHDNIH
jgi:hypothetical protein